MASPILIVDQTEPTGAQMKLVANILLESGVVKKGEMADFPASNGVDIENAGGEPIKICAECGQPRDLCKCDTAGHTGMVLGGTKAALATPPGPVVASDPEVEYRLAEPVYADAANKLWPIDSDLDMFKSAASIELQATHLLPQRLGRVREALNGRAMQFDVFAKVAAIQSHVRGLMGIQKQASVTYALPQVQRFPVSDAAQTRASAGYFGEVRGNYAHDLRKQAASGILDAALAHKVDIPSDLLSQLEASAGRGVADPIKLARALAYRGHLVVQKHPGEGVALYKAACSVAKAADAPMEQLQDIAIKSAAAMDDMDCRLGLNVKWGKELDFPEDAAFCLTVTKCASALSQMVMIGGDTYWRTDVAAVPAETFNVITAGLSEKVASADGKTDPDKLVKFASDAVFSRVLNGFGLKSVANAGSAHKPTGWLQYDDEISGWERIASQHGARITQFGNTMYFPLNHKDRVTPMPAL
jgi:hypothetical protein